MTDVKRTQEEWDQIFLGMSKAASRASKDPSTKVGAIIVRQDRSEVSFGYNGFPKKIADTPERLNDRPTKYKLVLHAEVNALQKARENLAGCTIYVWPLFSCANCALQIINAGIIRVVSPPPDLARWQSSYDEAAALYAEAGVDISFIEGDIE